MKYLGILAAAVFLFCFAIRAEAADESMYGDFSGELAELYDSLPEDLQDRYGGMLTDAGAAKTVMEDMGYSSVLSALREAILTAWPSAVRLMFHLLGMILCAGLFAGMNNTLGTPGISAAFSLCTTLCFSLSLTESVETLLQIVSSFLTGITRLSSGLAPIVCSVTAAQGRLSGAAVSQAALMLLFTLFQNIGTVLLLPVVRVSYCFGIIGAIGGPVRLDSLTKCLRKAVTTVLSFLMLLLSFVIGVQTALARSADTFSVKTVKFALGNVIPMIGGALSDAVTTVGGSLGLIRSASGGIGVLALLLLVLPVIVQLLLHRLVLGVCQGAAEMIGCDREAKLIGEVHGTVGFMLAIVGLVAVLFFFVVGLFTLIGGGAG